MLIKLLSDADKEHLIELSKLLAISDKPLLWNGKTKHERAYNSDNSSLSIQEGEQERELIADLQKSVNSRPLWHSTVKHRLLEELKKFPAATIDKPEIRAQAATVVFKELFKRQHSDSPSAPKIMLFELIMIALRDGKISNIEWTLLKEFQQHHQLEDFIFDDLLDRAEVLNQEVSKAISIVLE